MSLVAVIYRNGSRLSMAEWLRCISDRSELKQDSASRRGINPFTGQETIFLPEEGVASIVIDGDAWGAIAPAAGFDCDGDLEVFAPSDKPSHEFREVVAEVARMLGANVEWAIT